MKLRKPNVLPGDDPKPGYRHLDLSLALPLPSLPVPSPSGVGVRFDDNRGYQADDEEEEDSPITLAFDPLAISAITPPGPSLATEFTMDALPSLFSGV
ncbi:hypothetical protein PG985_008798 [Apiospora marii]|uniref:Uncharacterized protein n=1 Tax=Apiospora marii TaxID=335849 RepID=A0ABR1R3D1_9PEZI